jgi:hypothetical protein
MNRFEKDLAIAFLKNYVFLEGCQLIFDYLKPQIEGKLIRTFSAPNMSHPGGTAIDGDMLYVANPERRSVIAFDIPSGNVVLNLYCSHLYSRTGFGSGPHTVFVTRDWIVLTGSTQKFEFFQKGSGLHAKSLPYPAPNHTVLGFCHTLLGELICVLSSLEYDVVLVFDFHGKFVQKLPIVLGEHKHTHKPKTQLFFAGDRFYLFERYKLLIGTFSHKDSTVLLVEQINDWNPAHLCGAVASDEEIYCNVYLDRAACRIGCVTSTGHLTQVILFAPADKDLLRLTSPSFSSQRLSVSDRETGNVYLFE